MTANSDRRFENRLWLTTVALLWMLVANQAAAVQGNEPGESWVTRQFQRFRTYPHLDRAYRLIAENRLDEARLELERYLSLAPADRAARTNYMLLLYRLKRYGPVIGEASRLLQDKPEAAIYLNRALAREKLKDAAGALDDYLRAAAQAEVQPAERTLALQQAADLALTVRKPEVALKALDTLGPSPSPYTHHLRRGMALGMAGQLETAAKAFALAASTGGNSEEMVRALEFEADSWKKAGNWDASRQALDRALLSRPDSVPILRSLADVAYQQKRYDDTVRHLRHALSLQERPAERELLVRALQASGKTGEAATELESLLRNNLGNPRLYLLQGELALQQKKADAARIALTRVLQQDPTNIQALRLMARVYSEKGKPRESIRWMGRIPIPQRNTDDIEFLAGLYLSQGQPSSAAWLYKKLLQTANRDDVRYRYLVQLGEAYKAWGRFEDAREALLEAYNLHSGFPAMDTLVEVLLKSGRQSEAVAQLDRAVESPLTPEQQARAGTLYTAAGSADKATRQLTAALQGSLPPASAAQAYAQRGFAYRGLDRLREARSDFEFATGLDSSNAGAWLALGEACLALGDFPSAIQALTRARSLQDDVTVRLLHASALEGAGDSAQALALYAQVLNESQSHPARAFACLTAMANLESRLGRHADAAEHATQAFEVSQPGDWRLLAQALNWKIAAGDWNAADSIARRLGALAIPREAAAENWERKAQIALRLGQTDTAAECFANAIGSGQDGWKIHQQLGLVLYDLGRKQKALDAFELSLQKHEAASTLVFAGRCARELGRDDVALSYFDRALASPVDLGKDLQCEACREIGHVHFGAADYRQAAAAWQKAALCGSDRSLAVKIARAWRLAGEFGLARNALTSPPLSTEPAAAQAEYFEELALHLKESQKTQEAIPAMSKAVELDPQPGRHYLLGQWHRETGNSEPALAQLAAAVKLDATNAEYRSALGYALLAGKNYAGAAVQFEEALRLQPDSVTLVKDLGYVYVRLSRNKDAARCFANAIAIESQEVLARSDRDPQLVRREVGQLRQELERLENRWDITAFVAQSSDKRQLPPAPPALGLGLIPSYAGTEIAFTPPKIGLRNERIFQVFGRFLTNLRPASIKPDPASYTVGVGARYKPVRTQNLFVSGERIFGVNDSAGSSWLLRSMFSKDSGYDLKPGRSRWNYSLMYGDLGLYLSDTRLLIGYGEFRQGVSFNVQDTVVITPHVLTDGRFYRLNASADPYVEAGGGLSFKFFLRHGDFDLRRASFEVLVHYRAGRAINPEKDTFSGFAATAILGF